MNSADEQRKRESAERIKQETQTDVVSKSKGVVQGEKDAIGHAARALEREAATKREAARARFLQAMSENRREVRRHPF